MGCSTCDSYEFIPDPDDPDGALIDCPDCRAVMSPIVLCPLHKVPFGPRFFCRGCRAEADAAAARIMAGTLLVQAAEVAEAAA